MKILVDMIKVAGHQKADKLGGIWNFVPKYTEIYSKKANASLRSVFAILKTGYGGWAFGHKKVKGKE